MANKRRCSTCKDYFHPSDMYKSLGVQAFCTVDCMNKKRPKAKRRDDIPPTTRHEVKLRFNHMCAYCGRSHSCLHIHHIKYRSEGVDHSLGNLVLLCDAHHDMVHSNKRKWQPMLMEFIERLEGGLRPSLALMEKEWEDENV